MGLAQTLFGDPHNHADDRSGKLFTGPVRRDDSYTLISIDQPERLASLTVLPCSLE
jgi:hypothetical protein